jgi:hypothetical protein
MSLQHSPRIVTNGLVLCLDAANRKSYPRTGSAWTDLTNNGNNGTLINGPSFSGANRGAIVFNGSNNYVTTNKTATELGFYDASYTMEAWVYPTDLTSDKTMFGTDQTEFRKGLHLVFRSSTIYQGHYSSDFGAGTVNINNWYQIVYTYNKANNACQIFKNSIIQGAGSIGSFIGDTSVNIGRWTSAFYFNGNGAIYRIYNRVLTAQEIQQNYNANRSRFGL